MGGTFLLVRLVADRARVGLSGIGDSSSLAKTQKNKSISTKTILCMINRCKQ